MRLAEKIACAALIGAVVLLAIINGILAYANNGRILLIEENTPGNALGYELVFAVTGAFIAAAFTFLRYGVHGPEPVAAAVPLLGQVVVRAALPAFALAVYRIPPSYITGHFSAAAA